MEDVQATDDGSGRDDQERWQIERKAEEHEDATRAHAPPDRMDHDPVTEPAQQTAHLHHTPRAWIADER